jgi:lipoprotein-anchoring transpeptidase ErfK/SrfK
MSVYSAEFDPFAPAKPLRFEVIPYAKTYFEVIDHKTGKRRFVDMSGKDFILVSVRERGSDGRFYAVDKDGTVWLSGPVSTGVPQFRTPSGFFPIFRKDRYYMSKRYPDENGTNNMNFAMWFHKGGYALHEGDTEWMSHGCVHIGKRDVAALFRWSRIGMPVIVTRHSYMPFVRNDLERIYGE